jgi:hypothetical protein
MARPRPQSKKCGFLFRNQRLKTMLVKASMIAAEAKGRSRFMDIERAPSWIQYSY